MPADSRTELRAELNVFAVEYGFRVAVATDEEVQIVGPADFKLNDSISFAGTAMRDTRLLTFYRVDDSWIQAWRSSYDGKYMSKDLGSKSAGRGICFADTVSGLVSRGVRVYDTLLDAVEVHCSHYRPAFR